ncbi:MAG: outer membrane beta-barrel protein, partial [Pseudomonadota bacterium]
GDSSTTIGLFGGNLSASAELEIENQWSLGLRGGYLTSPDTLWFLSLAYTQVETSDLTYNVTAGGFAQNGVLGSVGTFSGISLGGGVESRLGNNLSLKAEYRYTDLDDENVQLLPNDLPGINNFVQTTMEPTLQTGRISINYRFNLNEPMAMPLK